MSSLASLSHARIKSKTGCKTCKIRRVKCGEEKPQCLRCTSTGRRCDYASPVTQHVVSRALPTALSQSSESRERRAFEYYFYHAAPSLSDALDLEFWRGTILRVSGSEPAIWDAIAALSTFYEHPPPIRREFTYQFEDTDVSSQTPSRVHKDALAWYSRSMKRLQGQIPRGTVSHTVALVSCVLFLCIEMLQGNIKSALGLYHHGMQLMESIPETLRSDLEVASMAVLLRVGTIAVIVTRDTPLPARLPRILSRQNTFASLSDARLALYALVAEWKVLDESCGPIREASQSPTNPTSLAQIQQHQKTLEGHLVAWDCQYRILPEVVEYNTSSSKTLHEQQGIIATLFMTHHSILILTRNALSTTESCYDAYEPAFAEIISHAPAALAGTAADTGTGTQPPFIFDMGTGMSLFIVALRCRSPSIRRQALRYLPQAPPLQGMYFSHSASSFFAALVAIEERGKKCEAADFIFENVLAQPGRVPLENERIFSIHLRPWETEKGEMRTAIQYSRRETVNGEVLVVHDTVVLPARAPHRSLTVL